MALFRVDFSGRGELSERQQKVLLLTDDFQSFLNYSQLAQVCNVTEVSIWEATNGPKRRCSLD